VRSIVLAVFTVQEKVGLKGGRTPAFGKDPDVALEIGKAVLKRAHSSSKRLLRTLTGFF